MSKKNLFQRTFSKENNNDKPLHDLKEIPSENEQKVTPVISNDQIALRAYFISERRRQLGWEGDENSDWTNAERQLQAEALEKPTKKK
ncbi:MAG: hypothetical protein A3F67_01145 [Verrucomicrobia bacterium RIFCSPHIGHO2_12_FULL_41_10]|nr:MAG: hypothetical protein A3F67_01145 [Verrucomicrobia bacterium RIFCSPHIGHO2_12_FULL_41_10]HLB33884.1 hypothetical protein [Chthoniobacterales bacterium]